jgi:predicted phosphodiesterase
MVNGTAAPEGLRQVAALFDIHGNLPALEAVLVDVERLNVGELIVGGDVFPGPMGTEVLARLRSLDVPVRFISGNGDRAVVTAKSGGDISEVPAAYQDVVRWAADTLEPEAEQHIRTWPATVRCSIRGLGEVLFCHATPASDTEIFTNRTPEARLLSRFEGLGVSIVVCGHTHMQFDRRIGPTRVVNAGSVGMPFAEPGAYWLLLGPEVQLRRTTYDLSAAAARIRATAYPRAQEFADRNVLQPPSQAEMLDAYDRVDIR